MSDERLKELCDAYGIEHKIKYNIGLDRSFVLGWSLGVSEETHKPTLVFNRPMPGKKITMVKDHQETERFYNVISPICGKLRAASIARKIEGLHCNECDTDVANELLRFVDIWLEEIQSWDDVHDVAKELLKIAHAFKVEACTHHDEIHVVPVIECGQLHFEYKCPYTDMTELIFPVISDGILIGFVISGQIIEDVEQVKAKVESMLVKQGLEKDITFTSDEWSDAAKHTKPELIGMLQERIGQLTGLYNRTVEAAKREVLDKAQEKLLECICEHNPEAVTGEYEDMQAKNNSEQIQVKKVAAYIIESLRVVRRMMGVENLVLYWDKGIKQSDLKIDGDFYTDWESKMPPGEHDWIKNIPDDVGDLFDGASKKVEDQDNIPSEANQHDWSVVICRPINEGIIPIIFGIRYKQKNLYMSRNSNLAWEEKLLPNFAVYIHNVAASLMATRRTSKLEETNELLSHEMGQVADGMRIVIGQFEGNIKRRQTEALQKPRAQKYYNNLEDNYHSLLIDSRKAMRSFEGQFQIIEMMRRDYREEIRPDPKSFDIYTEILNRWNAIFKASCRLKNNFLHLGKIAPHDTSDILEFHDVRDPDRWLHTDPKLLEHAIYNVVNNAIKYSYLNSRIYVGITTDDRGHVLTVTNYGGIKLDSEDRTIYKNGARINKAGMLIDKADIAEDSSRPAKGKGIGLYWTDLLVKALGGTITHKCVEVSPYYVSLMKPFFDRYETSEMYKALWKSMAFKQVELPYKTIRSSYDDLVAKDEYARIVNEWSSNELRNLGVLRIFNELSNPTYEVTFTIAIPRYAKEED